MTMTNQPSNQRPKKPTIPAAKPAGTLSKATSQQQTQQQITDGQLQAQKPLLVDLLSFEDRAELRRELGTFMRETRQALEPVPTQVDISKKLGFNYSIVTGFENATRNITQSQAQQWAKVLELDTDLEAGPLARFVPAMLLDEQAKLNKGDRTERDINQRIKELRLERNLSMREMAALLNLNLNHYARIESQRGNFSLTQLRLAAQRLRVSYEWLLDGAGKGDTVESLREENKRLRRENELLEQLRQQNRVLTS